MLRDILVHADRTPQTAHRVRLASDLAARHGAHLTILHVRDPAGDEGAFRAAELGLMPAAALERFGKQLETRQSAELDELRAMAEAEASAHGVTSMFVSASGNIEDVACQYARHADLAIIGHSGGQNASTPYGYTVGEAILFATGRPVVLVPPSTPTATLGRRVALAWNGSRPAARALTDALPIIEGADELAVLTAHPIQAPTQSALPADAILDHLRRHNGKVHWHELQLVHRAVAEGLQSEALRLGADVLIAGAYGHPKLWERFLGGVTRDLLSSTLLPLLMAH